MSPKGQGLHEFQQFLGQKHKARRVVQQKIQTNCGKDQARQHPEHPIVQTCSYLFFGPGTGLCIKIARRGVKSTKTIRDGFAIVPPGGYSNPINPETCA